ncbi:hypothetical protein KC19_1G005900 [Ceratodon purpureus]|uniref:Large ribosomal subunit protein bL31c n=1 Tax=Ceratodon purpureus TaxID=3225 RepID=A0A8T0J117_CERPU|nr:hypothetical protein KC19_1G005900 [Ceratodon purpureus]
MSLLLPLPLPLPPPPPSSQAPPPSRYICLPPPPFPSLPFPSLLHLSSIAMLDWRTLCSALLFSSLLLHCTVSTILHAFSFHGMLLLLLLLFRIQVNRGESRVTCKKAEIHPQYFEDAKVYCNGELVMTTGGTQNEYVVDVWSGNHPFYQGNKSALLLDADRVEKFRQRYGGFSNIQEIPTLLTGEIVFEKKRKGGLKGKGGKK